MTPETLCEGLAAFEFGAQITSPVPLKDIITCIGDGLPLVVQRAENVHLVMELLVVRKNKPHYCNNRDGLASDRGQSSHDANAHPPYLLLFGVLSERD